MLKLSCAINFLIRFVSYFFVKLTAGKGEENNNTGFIQCLKTQFWKRLEQKIVCRLPGFKEFMDNGTKLEKCSDKQLALNATYTFHNLVQVNLKLSHFKLYNISNC